MRPARQRNLSLAGVIAALVAAGALGTFAWRHQHPATPPAPTARTAAAPQTPAVPAAPADLAASSAVAPEAAASAASGDTEVAAAPGAEVVPPEEAETDRGPASASAAGPGMSFGRAAGLHLRPDPLRVSSSAALVLDPETGKPLAEKNADVVLPIASLTKLMTTLLVTEAKQPMDEVLTITEDDVDLARHSKSRLKVGTKLTREEALHLALMSSENRAAHALGRNYPGGLPKMVEAMNAKAKALGMKNTTYVDPTGLSNQNRSTARDLATLVTVAGKNPLMRQFSTDASHVAELSGRPLQYINSNRLVRNTRAGWDILLQKTGYIVEAGRCLTMLTKVAGHELVMVMLDSDSNGTRVADAERLRHYVVAQNGWNDDAAMLAKARAAAVAAERKSNAAATGRMAATRKGPDKADRRLAAKANGSRSGKAARGNAVAKSNKGGRTAVANSGKGGKKAVSTAHKDGKEGGGRVKQTFAAGKDHSKG